MITRIDLHSEKSFAARTMTTLFNAGFTTFVVDGLVGLHHSFDELCQRGTHVARMQTVSDAQRLLP